MKAGAKPASGMRREAVRRASAVRTTPMRARTEARPAPHQPGTMAAVVPAAANPAAALQPSHAGRQPVSREEDTPLVTASVVFILLFSFLSGLLVGAFPRLPADGALESPEGFGPLRGIAVDRLHVEDARPVALGFFNGSAFAVDESDDGAHGMPVDDDAREFDRRIPSFARGEWARPACDVRLRQRAWP